ncbi:putative Actin-interacting protein 1-2 [Cocos nucifera]|uniref:Putative Actin-interacting protein 1-2 n=1 Tax=Cocos nucifera TaxID=13894 RepID=A0A8K0I317_COCNU|nr:putative Actin-interacting protein 1-2 [Cocos nucifera]KAG1334809.1 putative Actin-interacting protein 1-2 [Cocos nucifera]
MEELTRALGGARPWDLDSADPRTNSIVYTNGRSVIIRWHNGLASIYCEQAYQATVARFSPNGEWVFSADLSGIVRIWGHHGDHVLKNGFRVLSGRIDR